MPTASESLLLSVVRKYLDSGDFNGLPFRDLASWEGAHGEEIPEALLVGVEEGDLSLNFGLHHPNPHIRAFPDPPIEEQLQSLAATASDPTFVVYPTAKTLALHVDRAKYDGRPFALRMALGAAQLEYAVFDPAVIDQYRRDPRYRYWSNDITASLSVSNEAYESSAFPDKHKVLLQNFGFAYDDNRSRAVAVFYRDLNRLTPEYQQVWAAFECTGTYRLHPDFFRAAIMGDWGQRSSLREALAEELRTINAMCVAIGWSPMFRSEFESLPREVALLLRPTRAEFNAFVHELDKVLSDNIDRDFFPPTIARETERVRDDGKVVVELRGSLSMLSQWFELHFRTSEPEIVQQAVATLKEVRRLRQTPAHKVATDEHDVSLFAVQRELFDRTYGAVRTIRLAIANHPKAAPAAAALSTNVREGRITSF